MAINFLKKLSSKDSRIVSTEFRYGSGGGSGVESSAERELVGTSLTYEHMKSMYEVNPWIRACIDKVKDRASSVKPLFKCVLEKNKFKPTDEQKKKMDELKEMVFVHPNHMNESFESIRRKIFWDILVYDAGCTEWIRDVVEKKVIEMFAVAGETVKKNVNKNGIFENYDKAYEQWDINTSQHITWFKKNELCYMMANPRSSRVYGLSPLETLQQTVTAELYAADFNLQRFVNDATPRFAVLMKNLGVGQSNPAITRFRKWWDREMKGHPHRPMILTNEGGDIDFVKVSLTNEEMQFQQYSLWLLKKIMAIYKVPPFVLGVVEGTTGKLNSEAQEEQFKKDAITPLLSMFAWHFNTEVIWAADSYNWNDVYMHWEGIDIEDEFNKAKRDEIYLKTGVFTINMVLNSLGLDGVPWGDIPYMQIQYQPIGTSIHGNNGNAPSVPPSLNASQAQKIFNNIEPTRMKKAIEKLLMDREKVINKFWSIPNEVAIKNVLNYIDEVGD